MHYSPYFLLIIIVAIGTKANVIEGCQTWMSLTLSDWMSSLNIYVNLKPEAIKILKLWLSFWSCSTWISTKSCGMKEQSVQYTSHFTIHSMQAMVICSRNGSSCLNCGIYAWKLALLMWIINASLHCGVVTVQQGWGVLTHFVDIYHLFTSTEKMRGKVFHNMSLTW